jgi:hypothetical protein
MNMYTTTIKDKDGNEFVVPQSHRNMAEVLRRIAEEKIKAFNLDCTPDEYWRRCKEKQEAEKK